MTEPGKYDKECEVAFKATQAALAMLIVVDGRHGNGFSVTMVPAAKDKLLPHVPTILRAVADDIEHQWEIQTHG